MPLREREKVQEVPRQVSRDAAAAVFSGVLYALSFPPFNLHYLAWVALVPLLAIKAPRFIDGVIAGFFANLIIFFWLWKTFAAANVGAPVTFAAWLMLAAILSLYFGVISLMNAMPLAPAIKPFALALSWTAMELLRSHILTGFPWALFAHTQATNLPLLQWAAYSGEEGLSFILFLVNAAIAGAIRCGERAGIRVLTVTLAMVVFLLFGGRRIAARKQAEIEVGPKMKVALLQGDIDQYQKWDEAYEAGIRQKYAALAREAARQRPDLIVWPESALPAWYPNDAFHKSWLKNLVIASSATHLVGAVTRRDDKEFNAAFLVGPKGEPVAEYDKQKMVPFGEYLPFGEFLRGWIPYLGQLGTFDAGEEPVLFEVNGVFIAPNVCYEAFFPRVLQRSLRLGADVFVNITNDGWFLDTAAPEQHFVANIFRAVESGRPVVRAANTGISAVIDSSGKVRFRSPLLVPGCYVVDVPLASRPTFFSMLYSRHVARTEKPDRNP